MQITTPDIGVDKAVVAEILVKVGDTIAVDDSVVLLESDKASVEVPSTSAGVVKSILVNLGDSVAEGAALIELEAEGQTEAPAVQAQADVVQAEEKTAPAAVAETVAPAATTASQVIDVQVPDIGVEKATVGEILVSVGDQIDVDQSILVVESDKATVEVPSTISGTVESISVQVGDSVKEGVVILTVKTAASVAPVTAEPTPVAEPQTSEAQSAEAAPQAAAAPAGAVEIAVPDLGVDKATVAEILVSVGDTVEKDQSIIVVESDKATVEVPSTTAGVIKAIHVALGQNVSEGVALVTIEAEGQAPVPVAQAVTQTPAKPTAAQAATVPVVASTVQAAPAVQGADKLTKEQNAANAKVYAGPAVRKLARELGVVLSEVSALARMRVS
jgi:pyruvate dehydrogenase E2 component (dihydrolipoamide acetyltransferase)